jgi:hypothetical protein
MNAIEYKKFQPKNGAVGTQLTVYFPAMRQKVSKTARSIQKPFTDKN